MRLWRTLRSIWWRRHARHGDNQGMRTPIDVQHLPDQQTFAAVVDGHRCVADYRLDGRTMHMHHTEVHPALEGRGIAAQLVTAALTWARQQGLKVNPSCSYVRVYMQRHPEWQDLRA